MPTQLDAVTTAATRTARPLDVPATAAVFTTEDIDRENMQDIRDLTPTNPAPRSATIPSLPGFQNFLIRVLVVLHDLNMAARYADRVAIVEKGGLPTLGPPEPRSTRPRCQPCPLHPSCESRAPDLWPC